MTDKIQIELTQDEAIVLFERLVQLDQSGALPAEDSAEEQVFWGILAQLEKILVEPFDPEFKNLVADAKERLMSEQK